MYLYSSVFLLRVVFLALVGGAFGSAGASSAATGAGGGSDAEVTGVGSGVGGAASVVSLRVRLLSINLLLGFIDISPFIL
tara:strand:- start:643 stop:882 length:240 start_codon:yes stop_codon:yes gene_type:complete